MMFASLHQSLLVLCTALKIKAVAAIAMAAFTFRQ
jgi:hypothetical protein